eukprot:jgi/Mesvir1/9735/Mv12199-RA.1
MALSLRRWSMSRSCRAVMESVEAEGGGGAEAPEGGGGRRWGWWPGSSAARQRAAQCRHICGKGGHVLLESFLKEGADGGFGGEGGGGRWGSPDRGFGASKEGAEGEALELGAIHAVNDWESVIGVGKLAITRPAAAFVGREVHAQG